jgi:hypothetical protein
MLAQHLKALLSRAQHQSSMERQGEKHAYIETYLGMLKNVLTVRSFYYRV